MKLLRLLVVGLILIVSLAGCYPHNSTTCDYRYIFRWVDLNHNGQYDPWDNYFWEKINVSPGWKYWC